MPEPTYANKHQPYSWDVIGPFQSQLGWCWGIFGCQVLPGANESGIFDDSGDSRGDWASVSMPQ